MARKPDVRPSAADRARALRERFMKVPHQEPPSQLTFEETLFRQWLTHRRVEHDLTPTEYRWLERAFYRQLETLDDLIALMTPNANLAGET